jgi:hypothetical protein
MGNGILISAVLVVALGSITVAVVGWRAGAKERLLARALENVRTAPRGLALAYGLIALGGLVLGAWFATQTGR